MTVVATRGTLRLVDDGGGMGHIEGREEQRPLQSFLKWGYWKPVDAMTAAGPLEGEEPFVLAYEKLLERNANAIVRRYRRAMRVVTAAGEPNLDQVLNEADLTDAQRKALKLAREELARQAAFAQAVDFGISFAITSPALPRLIEEHAGRQAERIFAGSREIVARVLAQSFEEGWSVPQTAKAIQSKLKEAKRWQATMLARTDLIGLANAGSYAAALQLGEQAPVYKRWINADDEKVRPTHVEAQNQIVRLEQEFTVGGAALRFPGDPLGPDDEVINCRCTLVYLNDPTEINDHLMASAWATIAAGWDESEHPRDDAGKFTVKEIFEDTRLTNERPVVKLPANPRLPAKDGFPSLNTAINQWLKGRGGNSMNWVTEIRYEMSEMLDQPFYAVGQPYDHGMYTQRPPSPGEARGAAHVLLEGLRMAKPEMPELWRGMGDAGVGGTDEREALDALREARPGDTFTTLPVSFTTEPRVATMYGTEIVIRVEPGSRAIKPPRDYFDDREVLGGGEYEVVSVENVIWSRKYPNLELPADDPLLAPVDTTVITVRQKRGVEVFDG